MYLLIVNITINNSAEIIVFREDQIVARPGIEPGSKV